jgi:transposase
MTDILDLPGWNVINKRLDGDDYLIEAEYTIPPKSCLKCGSIGNLYKHGPKPLHIRDSPIRGRPVRILANAQRYKCRDCGGTFIQPLGGIFPESRMTERCAEYIRAQCLRDTFLRIAEHVGCDDKTVRNLAGDYIKLLDAAYVPRLPEWLGIDETQIDGKLRCIITDVVNRVPIEMLPDRDKTSVVTWLHKFKGTGVVKGLAMDMWRPYKDAAQFIFPGLPVVVDKFHVVRMANTALDDVRKGLAKTKEKGVGTEWMRRSVLLRMRHKNLDEKGRFNVQIWLDNEPDIAEAYKLKEGFFDIYDALTKEDAAKRLDAWRASIPARWAKTPKKFFTPLLTCTKNWREEILAFFDYPISNGYTEALNGVAKVINRQGRGYSFEVLRARILFGRKPVKERFIEDRPVIQCDPEIKEPTEGKAPPDVKVRSLRQILVAKYKNRCQSCLGTYDQTDLHITRMGPLMSDEPEVNATLMCGHCKVRFHTEKAYGYNSASTP